MTLLSTGLSLLLGIGSGIIYGLSFLSQTLTKAKSSKVFASFFFIGIFRFLLIASLFYYILHTNKLSIILVLLTFLISFWAVIIKK